MPFAARPASVASRPGSLLSEQSDSPPVWLPSPRGPLAAPHTRTPPTHPEPPLPYVSGCARALRHSPAIPAPRDCTCCAAMRRRGGAGKRAAGLRGCCEAWRRVGCCRARRRARGGGVQIDGEGICRRLASTWRWQGVRRYRRGAGLCADTEPEALTGQMPPTPHWSPVATRLVAPRRRRRRVRRPDASMVA